MPMAIIQVEELKSLTPQRARSILKRSMEDISGVYAEMRDICADIRERGDAVSLKHYAKYKADITVADLKVTSEEIRAAYEKIQPKVVEKLKFAATNIEKFHRAQVENRMWSMEVLEGVVAGRVTTPVDSAGCYVPGGSAMYPSSVLMTIIPAKAAGVGTVVAATPPKAGMVANPATLVACDIAGADEIYKVGGPWAIASMAYGTGTIKKVDKIVGPGNKYVTAAKMVVFGAVDIDSPAGPSEALIVADETANPRHMAIDFLSQVEHDPDAAAVLVTTSRTLAQQVCEIIEAELGAVARRDILESAITKHSAVLVAETMDAAVAFTNEYAAEHLQIVTEDPMAMLPRIRHAGSIFLGPNAPVPVGDYASGTNHVLPTGQCARMFSGLSVDDFVKKMTFQYLSKGGLERLADAVITLAEEEGLPMHARTVRERVGR
jgi:histidinol dehydrogenase